MEKVKYKSNVHFKKEQLFSGLSYGVFSAMLYSLAPMLIIFLPNQDSSFNLSSFVLVTIQEIISWIVVICLARKPLKFIKQTFKENKNVLSLVIIVAGVFGGPIAQVLYVLSIKLVAQMSNTATVLVNIAPIFTALLSRLLLDERLSFIAWTGLVISSLAVIGLVIWQLVIEFEKTAQTGHEDIPPRWVQAVWAIILSLLTAILYAIESAVLYFAMKKSKKNISEKEALLLKSFSSSIVMLLVVLPSVSWLSDGYGYEGWETFKILGSFKGLSFLFVSISSLAIAFGRIFYFKTVKILNASYGLASQLAMLIWTPLFSLSFYGIYIFFDKNFGIIHSRILEDILMELYSASTQWVYYVFLIPIFSGLILLIFNEKFLRSKKRAWKIPIELK